MGAFRDFMDFATRNTDDYVSGTTVTRDQVDSVEDAMNETEDTGDVYPDWRDDWQEAASDADSGDLGLVRKAKLAGAAIVALFGMILGLRFLEAFAALFGEG